MSSRRPSTSVDIPTGEAPPYPSWSAITPHLSMAGRAAEDGCQALKEVRIWRALAEEGEADGVNGTGLSRITDLHPRVRGTNPT